MSNLRKISQDPMRIKNIRCGQYIPRKYLVRIQFHYKTSEAKRLLAQSFQVHFPIRGTLVEKTYLQSVI